jgi:RND superfamily putative drug exporter
VLAVWAIVLTSMLLVAPSTSSVRSEDDSGFLPDSVPSRRAIDTIQSNFDKPPAMSIAAVVVERPGGLTGSPPTATQPARSDSDWGYIARVTARLEERSRKSHWSLMSPADPNQAYLRSNLVGAEDRAAVIKVDLPTGFASREAFEAVAWIEKAAAEERPSAGLNVAVTGSASYGRDSNNAAETSLKRTTWVCIIAVVMILLITYRALPAAAISLVTVTVAVVVAISIVAVGGALGWSVSMLVEIFTIVVGYGAGVDFSLFFLSRYHEELGGHGGADTRAGRRDAIIRALAGTGPAIVAAAATVAAGLSLMYFAKFRVFHSAGPAVAVSIILSCLASLTLAPVLAYLVGSRAFWPRRIEAASGGTDSPNGIWDRVAAVAVRRRVPILLLGLTVLVPLAGYGWRAGKVYDTLADLPRTDQSVRGAAMFQRHFPVGEMSPVQVLIQLDRPLSEADWAAVAMAVDRKLRGMPQVQQVRSLAHPLGLKGIELSPGQVSLLAATGPATMPSQAGPAGGLFQAGNLLAGLARSLPEWKELRSRFQEEVLPRHVGRGRKAGLWEVALSQLPYSNQALDSLGPLSRAVREAILETPQAASASPRVLMAGDTALMNDLRQVTNHDFWFVGALVVAAVVFIVTLLIRDLPVALFVMLATILSYGAALGLTSWAFHLAFGTVGLDWKVDFSLFVILVAVGQDYNLFMLTRIMEKRRRLPLAPAVQASIARTGSIISYCGLIMAATLGSLASSPLRLLQELGTAFIIGLLIDTFLVRPLMVPAFILVFKRMNRG